MIRAIRRVQIDRQERIPAVEHVGDQAARFGGLELHVVPVEIETLRVLPNADAVRGTVLRRPVLGIDLLIAVGVVDRSDENDHLIAQRSRG